MTNQLQILHLSDLHISKDNNFDRSTVLDPLIERVKEDSKKGITPELVIVTGDIGYKGKKEEYDEAKKFFTDLLKELKLPDQSLFIVPGNHDVDRTKYRPKDVPVYENMKELNDELGNKDYRADLLKGMTEYFDFIKTNFPHIESLEDNLIPFVTSYKAECKKKIALVGMNSVWMCREKNAEIGKNAIGQYQIKTAMDILNKKNKKLDLVICAFHHPLKWLWSDDQNMAKQYLKDKIILCGHLHDAGGGWYNEVDSSYYLFQAGTTYLNKEKWPERYQYLTYDWDDKKITLDFRSYSRKKGIWIVDTETGDDGKKEFYLERTDSKKSKSHSPQPLPEIPQTYLEWIKSNYGHMDADKLYGKGNAFPLSLPEIFIPLYSYKPGEPSKKGKKLDEERKSVDIEEIISDSEYLIIEGQAGSGKTTLLKHMAYCLAVGKSNECKIKGTDNLLPLLIQLKDVNYFFSASPKGSKKVKDVFHIIAWYIANKQNGFLTVDTVKKYVEDKKTIILLDGLDELLPEYRDTVVNAFADLGIKYKGNKIIFTSRPHGIEGASVKRFGDRHIKILSLVSSQINLFINRWFKYLYPGEKGIGRKNAEAMIGEIRVHPAINQLVDNPLMLTAICILYHDDKELPGQRAELYKKFIDNMLYRRFPESEKVYTYLKKLAFIMHAGRVRGRDKSLCIENLSDVYTQNEGEKKDDYKKRLIQVFDDIESKCGLLKFEGGELLFWHLSFQEFLTALYTVDNSRDYSGAIKLYWGDDWYKEVIELYIGYLSIDNKTWANGIVADTLNAADKHPFKKWLLAAESLVDMHRDRREHGVEEKAKQCLLSIIETENDPKILFQSGEKLGWLGDPRGLETFVPVEGGDYKLEDIGNVKIKQFEIGKYPVTNIWYARFIKEGGYTNEEYWSNDGKKWLKKNSKLQPKYWDGHKWKCPNSPVVGVCWYEADAFCRWLTLTLKDGHIYRLPSEEERQAASAGKEGRKYPWGKRWDKNRCNNCETGINKTSPVGVFENGRTPEGVYDLSGNVWEWTSSDYDKKVNEADFKLDGKEYPVLLGGSWFSNAENCRCGFRFNFSPNDWYYGIGFRCART